MVPITKHYHIAQGRIGAHRPGPVTHYQNYGSCGPGQDAPGFFNVIGSRRNTHARSITHIGMVVVTNDASPGETTEPESETSEPATAGFKPSAESPGSASGRSKSDSSGSDTSSSANSDSPDEMRKIVAGALETAGKIAQLLSTPESTKALVDAIVKEDPQTGRTTLNIPVPDKSTVVNILSAFSAFLTK